jgi:hypothetical protein
MQDDSYPPVSIHERALQLALKEILAQQRYMGAIPAPVDYQTVARHAMQIERLMRSKCAWYTARHD